MDRVEIKTTPTPEINFKSVEGSLRLKGWDQSAFRADCNQENSHKIEQGENSLTFTSTSGCMVRTPMESELHFGKIAGDLMIKSAEGRIHAGVILGQVMAKSVGPMQLQEVRGNVNARGIDGDFSCQDSWGNINLQDVEGSITIGHTKGNLIVKGFCAGITANVNGNTNLQLDAFSEGQIEVRTGGSISCRLMPVTNASIKLKSGSDHIQIKQDKETQIISSPQHEIVIGAGESQIILEAKGNIDLFIPGENEFDLEYEFTLEEDLAAMTEDISEVVTQQLETQLDALSDHLTTISTNLSALNPEINKKTKARIEAKRAKLERKLAKLERSSAEKARQTNQRATRRFQINTRQSEPVSDEERQKVLEMLQNKLISVEDAEALLAALEGKS